MKTRDLIEQLASRSPALPKESLRRSLSAALVLGVGSSLLLMMALYGRPAMAAMVAASPSWWFALMSCLALVAASTFALLRAARPGPFPIVRTLVPLGILLVLLLSGLVTYPVARSTQRMTEPATFGWLQCLMCIPLFALPAALILFLALRTAAPSVPWGTGALVGLVAGSSGAVAFSCCSLVVVSGLMTLWYGLAIALCAAIGAVAGRAFLRW